MQDGKELGKYLSIAIGIATVIISGVQVWTAYIQKDREIKITMLQKSAELEAAEIERERRWGLDAATFIFEHRLLIFSANESDRNQIKDIMLATFPLEITDALFRKLEVSVSDEQKAVWRTGQDAIDNLYVTSMFDEPVIEAKINSDLKINSIESISPVPGTLPEPNQDDIIEGFKSADRRTLSRNLAKTYSSYPTEVVDQLINSILPDDDRWSYRVNLYVVSTLERITPCWESTILQRKKLISLRDSPNYQDETFKNRLEGAVKNICEQ
jgi:hypothetical protein